MTEAAADSDSYYLALERFFRTDAAFAHFVPVVISDEPANHIDIMSGYGRQNSEIYAARCSLQVHHSAVRCMSSAQPAEQVTPLNSTCLLLEKGATCRSQRGVAQT